MAVTQVGTPGAATRITATGNLTPAYSGTQPRNAGDVLLACVSVSAVTSSSALPTPAGWTKIPEEVDGTNRLAWYWKIASQGETAPTFTSVTFSGTGAAVAQLFECTGNDPTTPVVTSGSGSGATAAQTATTSGNVPNSNCYAFSGFSQFTSSTGTRTWTVGGSWVDEADDFTVNSRSHQLVQSLSAPTSGSTLTGNGTFSTTPTTYCAQVIVIQPPTGTSVNVTGVGASVTVAGGVGTFEGDAGVTGVGASVTVAGGVGTFSAAAGITGVAAQVTVAGGVGTPLGTSPNANVTGVGASVTAAGGIGTPAGSAGVTGVAASVAVGGGVGTFSASASTTGVAAHVAVAGGVGTPSGNANVTGVGASVPLAGGVGTLEGDVHVTGVAASVTVAGGVGIAAGSGAANVSGVAASVTVAGGVGVFSATANITGVAASVTSAGGVGTPSGSAQITGVGASVTVAGGIGLPSAGGSVNVSGVAASVAIAGGIGTFAAGAGVTGLAAQALIAGGVGAFSGSANPSGVAAHVTIAGGVGVPSGAAGVTGIAAHLTIAGGVGTPSGSAGVSGIAAHILIGGGAGVVGASTNLAGVAAQITVIGGIGAATTGPIPRPPEILSGSITYAVTVNGAASFETSSPNGILSINSPVNGSIEISKILGSASIPSTPNGTRTEWAMQSVALTLPENNNVTVDLAFTQSNGYTPYNLSTVTSVDVFLKTGAGVSDTDVSTIKLTTTGGSPAVTITNAAEGLAEVVIPVADIETTSINFWRADIVDASGNRNTAMYGKVTVQPL